MICSEHHDFTHFSHTCTHTSHTRAHTHALLIHSHARTHTHTHTHTHAHTRTPHTLAHKLEQRCQNTCNLCVFYKILCTLLTNRLRPFGDFNHHTVTSSNRPPSAHQRLSSLSLSVLVIMFVFFSDSFKCFHTADMFPRLYLITGKQIMNYGFNCIMMFTCQEQSSSLPFTCNFYYSLRIVVIFLLPLFHIPHCTAQMMDSERAGVLLAAVTSNAKHFCMVVFHAFFAQHRNDGNSFAYAAVVRVLLAVSGRG